MRCTTPSRRPADNAGGRWILVASCAVTLLVCFVLLRYRHTVVPVLPASANSLAEQAEPHFKPGQEFQPHSRALLGPTADEIVSAKLAQFAHSRRELAHALAQRHSVEVPLDVELFFAAVESGDWNRIEVAFKRINGGDSSAGQAERPPGVARLWPAIVDAYGAAEQVHLWPAQQLLDYGNSILGVLRPGMVYVGGTDNGRWIPELLNDTSEGEHHIVVTQNGLADASYLDYLRLQYDGRLANLSEEDSQRAFEEYMTDARKRIEHDQQFPNEPKQVRAGEDISVVDGKVKVGGVVAVMGINERLLQTLVQNNPDLSFAIEQSFPFKSTYPDALPLGPLMELRAQNEQNVFTAERATQSLDFWRNVTQQVLSDPEAASSDSALKSYSHDVDSAADLLAAKNFTVQAEEAYRLGTQLWPGSPESVGRLADLLVAGGRDNEARQLLDDFTRKYPNEQKDLERISGAVRLLWTAKTPGP